MKGEQNGRSTGENSISASKKGGYVFHYNAPVLIVAANKKGYGNALAEDETITGGLILGYPDGGELNRTPLERKGNPVTWVS